MKLYLDKKTEKLLQAVAEDRGVSVKHYLNTMVERSIRRAVSANPVRMVKVSAERVVEACGA